MKKLSFSLVALLAIVFAVASAFSTAKINTKSTLLWHKIDAGVSAFPVAAADINFSSPAPQSSPFTACEQPSSGTYVCAIEFDPSQTYYTEDSEVDASDISNNSLNVDYTDLD